MAIGALQACREAGVSVPDDVAVAGFDNIPEGEFAAPRLTTVAPDLPELARETIALLVSRVAGEPGPARQVSVPWQILVRESTAGADARR